MKNSKIKKALNYIYGIDKKIIHEFLLMMTKELITATNYKDNIDIIHELTRYMTRRNKISKGDQIIFSMFLALLTQQLDLKNVNCEYVKDEIKLKGNNDKINIITNISSKTMLSQYSSFIKITKETFKDIFTEKTPILIETYKLNKRKFDTITLFNLIINDYKYELIMSKLVKVSLGFLFLQFQYYVNTKFSDINIEIKEYLKAILVNIFGNKEKELKEINYVP